MGILSDIIRGPRDLPRKPEGTPASPEKEEDTSIYRGNKVGRMEQSKFDYILRDKRLYEKTGKLPDKRIVELRKRLFGSGQVKRSDLEKAPGQLAHGKWGKYKDFSEKDRKDSERLIKALEEFHKK